MVFSGLDTYHFGVKLHLSFLTFQSDPTLYMDASHNEEHYHKSWLW